MACSMVGLPPPPSLISDMLNTSGELVRSYMLEMSAKEGDLLEYIRIEISEALKDLSLAALGRDFTEP